MFNYKKWACFTTLLPNRRTLVHLVRAEPPAPSAPGIVRPPRAVHGAAGAAHICAIG